MADPDAAPTEPTTAPAAAAELGVVDPLRFPGAAAAVRFLDRLPAIAQVFLALALVDLVARSLGVAGLPRPLDLAQPLTIVGFLPHLAFVLAPVVVLWRRPDAAEATPLVLAGVVVLALVELLALPLSSVVPMETGDLSGWSLVQLLAIGGRTGGYVALALGLAALTRSAPTQTVLGLSNLVMWLIAGAAVTTAMLTFLLPATSFGDPTWPSQVRLVNALNVLPLLAFAYLARVIVRGTSDLRRPVPATYTATGAIGIAAVVDAVSLALNLLALIQLAFALSGGALAASPGYVFALLAIAVDVLLVVALALGLADTSVRMPGPGGRLAFDPAAAVPSVAWPAPGGEVPVFRPVERPVAADVAAKPKARRGGRSSSKSKSKESPG